MLQLKIGGYRGIAEKIPQQNNREIMEYSEIIVSEKFLCPPTWC